MEQLFSQYGRVFDLLSEMIFILDSEGRIIDLNKTAVIRLGLDNSSIGVPIRELISEDNRDLFDDLIRSRTFDREQESVFLKNTNSRIDVSLELRELSSGIAPYLVVIAKDITEQKKKELDLLRYSNVIHYTINPIQITDASGIMVYVNPAFEKVTGYTRDELIGKNPKVLSSGKYDKEFWREVWKTILSGKEWVGRLENRRKDGSPFHTELVISPIVDHNGRVAGFLGAHRDITEQKILEQQLVRSQKLETFGTLAAGIAHEVGNPLTSISSIVQVIQRTTNDSFAQEKLELVKNQINRITKIIRELVDFSRPSPYEIKRTDVNAVVRDAVDIIRYSKTAKNITFTRESDNVIPPVNVVPDQLAQVFLNILMNAVDSCEGREGTISVSTTSEGGSIIVKISDTGVGIAEEDFEKIFDPFYTTKEVGSGTGLGLWVSYGIIKNFGGEILVESKEGEGSTFTVVLPSKGRPQ